MQGNEKFLGRVASYAHKHALWREGERILAAVSGGPDSLALLLALKLLAVKEKINIGCCCVNHHLRAAAGKVAADMQRLPSLIMVMIRQRRFYIIYFAGAV